MDTRVIRLELILEADLDKVPSLDLARPLGKIVDHAASLGFSIVDANWEDVQAEESEEVVEQKAIEKQEEPKQDIKKEIANELLVINAAIQMGIDRHKKIEESVIDLNNKIKSLEETNTKSVATIDTKLTKLDSRLSEVEEDVGVQFDE